MPESRHLSRKGVSRTPRTEIVALCDLVQERLETLGDIVNVPASAHFTDLDEMIRQTDPDIVAIPQQQRRTIRFACGCLNTM